MTDMDRSRTTVLGSPGTMRRATIWLIVLTALVRLVGAWALDLGLGESYYLSSARVLHLAYFDQPPLSLWLIWAAKGLFQSESPLLLRLPFVLIFAGSSWMIYRLGALFRSERAGFFAALIMNASILFQISIGSWLQPDGPLFLAWLVTAWLLARLFFVRGNGNRLGEWAWVGVWLGIGFLAKYHIAFLLAGTGLFALTNRDARKWILKPGPYLAILIAVLVSLPVIIWNMQNGWASFAFQGGRALGTSFHGDWLLRMILGQLLYIVPWIALPALYAMVLAALKGPNGRFPEDSPAGFAWFLVCNAIGPILFFTAVAAWSDTQFHFHWQAPGYVMLFALLASWADKAWARWRGLVKWWLVFTTVVTFALLGVLVSHAATGWMRHVLPGGETMSDPTGDALEWRELGQWFTDSGAVNENAFVAGLWWGQCGYIDKPLAGRLPLACLSDDPRNIAFNIDLEAMVGRDAYIVSTGMDPAVIMARFGAFFDSMEPVGKLDITRHGFVEVHDVQIVKGHDFHMNRVLPVTGDPIAPILTLPRTRITGLSGTIRNSDPVERTVEIVLDDNKIGTILLAADAETAFDIAIDSSFRAVGSKEAELALRDVAGDNDGLGFVSLAVRAD